MFKNGKTNSCVGGGLCRDGGGGVTILLTVQRAKKEVVRGGGEFVSEQKNHQKTDRKMGGVEFRDRPTGCPDEKVKTGKLGPRGDARTPQSSVGVPGREKKQNKRERSARGGGEKINCISRLKHTS